VLNVHRSSVSTSTPPPNIFAVEVSKAIHFVSNEEGGVRFSNTALKFPKNKMRFGKFSLYIYYQPIMMG